MGGFEAVDAAVGRGKTDGTSTIVADGQWHKAGTHSVGTTSRAATAIVSGIVGVQRRAMDGVVVGRVEADFVHVGLANEQSAGVEALLDTEAGGIVGSGQVDA